MKTLINKRNPQIRISAPEIKLDSEGLCYIIPQGGGDYLAMWKCYWTLVENGELSIEGLPWPNEELEVDWEKMVEFNCIDKKVKMTIHELINYYIDRECTDVAYECGF